MSKRITKISRSQLKSHNSRNRFEHWQIDNQVYFITARCREHFPAFAAENAKQYRFVPWVTSLLDNHYHSLGYLYEGKNLAPLVQRLHGSVAKHTRVNVELERAIERSLELGAFLEGVPYKRYQR